MGNLSETDFGFDCFLHSIYETETSFAKSSKPTGEMVWLAKPEIVQSLMSICLLFAVQKNTTKSRIYLFSEKFTKVFR